MKKSKLAAAFILLLFSCNAPEEKEVAAEETQPAITYPYTPEYPANWKIGDPANAKIVMDLYKAIEENKIDEFDKYLADTVQSLGYDNIYRVQSKAAIIKQVKDFRSTFKSVSEEFLTFVPLHNVDKDEDWIATWLTERVIRNDGSKDSTTYQEVWRFKNGKIYYRGAFARYKPK